MKKIKHSTILSCFFCITLFLLNSSAAFTADKPIAIVSEDATQIVIEGTATDLTITPSQYLPYKNISIPGYSVIKQSGSPAVLQTGQLLEIPEGCDIEVSSYPLETVEYHDFLLGPAPYRIVVDDEQGNKTVTEQYLPDFDRYSKAAYSPAELATVEFTGYLRDKRIARLLFSPVQYNPVSKTLVVHTRYRVHITFQFTANEAFKTPLTSSYQNAATTAAGDGLFDGIYKSILPNYKPLNEGTSSLIQSNQTTPVTIQSVQSEGSPYAVKATIESAGIYKITYENLSALGINLSATTNANIKVENRGNEIPLYRSGTGTFKAGDYILFYGEPFKSLYTKKNVYWIYQGSNTGRSMGTKDGSQFSGYTAQTTFNNTYHGEEDKMYWESIPNGAGVDHWFWERLQPTETTPAAGTYTATLNNIVTTAGNYSLKVNLRGETTLAHHTKVYVNNTVVKDFTWTGQGERTEDILNISPNLFSNGSNSIKIEEILDAGTTVDRIYINWFEINYIDSYVAETNELQFKGEGTGNFSFSVSSFSTSSILLFDITSPLNSVHITNPQITGSGSYTAKFGDTLSGAVKSYCAVATTQFKTPTALVLDTPSSLKTTRANIDYIIITNEVFYDDIAELRDYRTAKGLNVEVAQIQDIYDEFSYGIKDAQAIKDFLTYAYNNWKTGSHPTYVLLVGDASIDYKDNYGYFSNGNVDFVPTYIYQTDDLGDTPTDNWFVCVNGSDPLPDMIVGRLCVKTVDDVVNIINKITSYEAGSAGEWAKQVIFAADNDWSDFESLSNYLASLLPETFTAEKVYLRTYSSVEQATSDLINKINAGSLITNYAGHGGMDFWAVERLFRTPDDMRGMTNGSKLTFVMTFTCLNGFFPNPFAQYSLAEEFVRAPNKGAIACFAPTGLGYPSQHSVLAEKIFNRFFTDGDTIIGSAVYTGKINTYNQIQSRDILETFTLFGDPATALKEVDTAITTTILPDFDHDGIPDAQDNCPSTPNGPSLGTCMPGSDKAGSTCHSDADCVVGCSTNGNCSMSQEDTNQNGVGDVCEPSSTTTTVPPVTTTTTIPTTTTIQPTTTTTVIITTTAPCADSDADGVCNDVDNCPDRANGPSLGTCMPGSDKAGAACHSDADCVVGCSTNGNCSMSQEDTNQNGVGDVCEPSSTTTTVPPITTTTSIAPTTQLRRRLL